MGSWPNVCTTSASEDETTARIAAHPAARRETHSSENRYTPAVTLRTATSWTNANAHSSPISFETSPMLWCDAGG